MDFRYAKLDNTKFRKKTYRVCLLFRKSRSLNLTTSRWWARQKHLTILGIRRSKGIRKNWIGRKRHKNRNKPSEKCLYKPRMIYNWIFRFNKPNRHVRKWNRY